MVGAVPGLGQIPATTLAAFSTVVPLLPALTHLVERRVARHDCGGGPRGGGGCATSPVSMPVVVLFAGFRAANLIDRGTIDRDLRRRV